MNKQEVFNRVWYHLRTQNKPAWSDDISIFGGAGCVYRGEDENGTVIRCAIGGLIPDSVYKPRMEGKPINTLLSYDKLGDKLKRCLGITVKDEKDVRTFLRDLQIAHDNTATDIMVGIVAKEDFWEIVKKRLKRVANNYKLSCPE